MDTYNCINNTGNLIIMIQYPNHEVFCRENIYRHR
nr:MAG TPA: hypothetical protein [Caudoviricetes sp.]